MTQHFTKVGVACVAVVWSFQLFLLSVDVEAQGFSGNAVEAVAEPGSFEGNGDAFFSSDIAVFDSRSVDDHEEPVFELVTANLATDLSEDYAGQSSRRSSQSPPAIDNVSSPIFSRPESPAGTRSSTTVPNTDQTIFSDFAAEEIVYAAESSVSDETCSHAADGCRCRCKRCRENCGTRLGRFCHLVTQSVCCPDPCFRPRWTMLANASFFTEAVRPQARQRFRWEFNNNFRSPDRAEFLFGRAGAVGPAAEDSIDFHDLTYFVETGGDRLSLFIETPYRSIDLDSGGHFAGFADLTTGTKTLLHDSEIFQVATLFEVEIPTSNPTKGLSNGHVTLKPSLLFGVKTSEESYLQMQITEGIPIGGDPDFAGAYLSYSASLNRVVWGDVNNTSLIRTLEYSGVTFQDGAFTDTAAGGATVFTSGESFGLLGGGLRLNICNKINFGVAGLFRVTDISPDATVRTEFQFRH